MKIFLNKRVVTPRLATMKKTTTSITKLYEDEVLTYHLNSGLQSYSVHLERLILKLPKDHTLYTLQSADQEEARGPDYTIFANVLRKHLEHLRRGSVDEVEIIDWLCDQVDHLMQISHWYQKCENFDDFYRLFALSYRLFTGRCAARDLIRKIMSSFDSEVQSDTFGDVLKVLRNGLSSAQFVAESPIVQKITNMYSYLLVHGFLTKFGITLNDLEYSQLEQKALLYKYSSKKEMWLTVVDTTLFMCEKLHEYKLTGDASCFTHNATEYSGWLKEADRVIALAPFTTNLKPHGTTYFAFISDVSNLVERGEAYAKFTRAAAGAESILLKKKLLTLQLLKNTEITKRASQKERKQPFGVLVHGTSSVAKSTFTKMLFHYFGKLHGLDTDDHFRYVRCPADEYWSNFDSSKWCIQMDDIAYLLPNKSSEADPTLKEMLQVVNNVPYVPPQADLADKGKTPVLAKLVVATTNASDLNAHEYFWCPLAIRRRLGFVVHVAPKQKYIHENGRFIDPSKLDPIESEFPDYWNITVQKVVPHFDGQRDLAKLVQVRYFTSSKEFLKFYGEASLSHEDIQDKSMSCDTRMGQIAVCPLCLYTSTQCECSLEIQADLGDLSESLGSMLRKATGDACIWIVRLKWFFQFQMYCAKWSVGRDILLKYLLRYQPQDVQMRTLGAINEVMASPKKWRFLVTGLVLVASAVGLYFALPQNKKKDDKEAECENCLASQGNVYGTTEKDFQQEERSNVWYNDTMELARFEMPISSQSLVGKDPAFLRDLFGPNAVRLEISSRTSKAWKCGIGAVYIKGQYILANNHAFKHGVEDYDVTVIQSTVSQGLNSNLTVRIKETQLLRVPENDFCIFLVSAMPPRKDILKFWAEEAICLTRCLSVRRLPDGTVEKQEILGVQDYTSMPIDELKIQVPMVIGTGERDTRAGDCGAIGLANTPRGATIIGIHTLGYERQCGIMRIKRSLIESAIESLVTRRGLDIQGCVVGGGAPVLGLDGQEVPLLPVHHKSVFRYIENGTASLYGTLPGFRAKPRSRVCATPLQKEMLEHFGVEVEHGQPAMAGWEPWRKNLIDMVQPNVTHDQDVLDACVRGYVADIIRELPKGWEKDMMFLSYEAAINGLPGVMYIDRINCSTSMGFPWNKSKKSFILPDPTEENPMGVKFLPEVMERVLAIEAKYKRGERAYCVFMAHFKDEATLLRKCRIKKTRIFAGGSADWSIYVRSRLLTFVRLVQKNKFVFEAGPGTVTQSDEWGRIYDYLTKHGLERIIAGDFGKYDKKMIASFILAAFQIIYLICKAAGYSEEELLEVLTLGYDIAFNIVNFNGDLVEFFGTNPSGHPLTVIVNSLVNSLYGRYVYHFCNPAREVTTFKQNVSLFTYGDDNAMGVSPKAPWFTHTSYQDVMATIGVEYTMPDKETASIPYVHINDVAFLKRKWVWNDDVGAMLAPLDAASMHKSLTMWVPSQTIDMYAQMVFTISSANNEYFFHGREVFEKHRAFFAKILEREPYSLYVKPSTLPRWDDLVARFWKASNGAPPASVVLADHSSVTNKSQKSNNENNKEVVAAVTERTATCLMESGNPSAHFNKSLFGLQADTYEDAEAIVQDSQLGESVELSQTVTFIDNEGGVKVDIPLSDNSVAMVDNTDDISLGSFLARPTLIDTTTWTTADIVGVKTSIQPWYLYMNNTLIKKKIDNYAFLRGNLHVKVILNGTPFQYGAIRACYSPLLGMVADKITVPSPINPILVPYSQQPGFYLYPQANAGGEMVLPFFYPKNWLDITVAADVQNMGTLKFLVYAPLRAAVAGGTTTVTMRTYAWMTDVHLMGSTTKLTLQGDEYGVGPISRPASAIASAASMLSKVPIIGRFARATEIGAGAVSSIATLFGYTNVPTIDNIHAYQPMNGPMLASAHIGTAIQKLSLDPKQELSIDPSPHGIGNVDELSLAYLKSKESYFAATSWSTADTAGTQLWNMRVNPFQQSSIDINNSVAAPVGKQTYHIPLSYISQLFTHWRGDIIIRVKVVCTKFHKGRLKISYDPRADITITDPPENAVYTQILDIGEDDDVELRIPYHQALAWLAIDKTLQDNWTPGNPLAPRLGTDNGLLTIRVLTALTAPASGSINLLFFLRGGDNFEYANPTDHIGDVSSNVVPSFFQLQADDKTNVVPTQYTIGNPTVTLPERYAQNFGECVGSLRNLLHRSVVSDTIPVPDTTALYNIFRKVYKRMPLTPGYDPNASTAANKVVAAAGTAPYSYNTMAHVPYVAGMFLGYRGSVNYTLTPSTDFYGSVDDFYVSRDVDANATVANRFIVAQNTTTHAANTNARAFTLGRLTRRQDGTAGAAITATRTNGSLSFNLPDYNNYNFSLVDPTTYVLGNANDGTTLQNAIVQFNLKNPTAAIKSYTETCTLTSYIAAGPDFTCLFFLCCPTLFSSNGNPVAA